LLGKNHKAFKKFTGYPEGPDVRIVIINIDAPFFVS
jgi:hypothetical protein